MDVWLANRHNITMHIVFQSFFSNLVSSSSVDKALVKKGMQFKENLTKSFKWDFDVEPEDFAPTIVDV